MRNRRRVSPAAACRRRLRYCDETEFQTRLSHPPGENLDWARKGLRTRPGASLKSTSTPMPSLPCQCLPCQKETTGLSRKIYQPVAPRVDAPPPCFVISHSVPPVPT